jgi:type IV fimbrial biogenesis protein FimT
MLSTFKGFTLIELITVLSIAAIFLAAAVPGYYNIIQNNKVVTNTNKLASSLNLARMEAIKRGYKVSVCPAANASLNSCGSSAQWPLGWIVFTDADNNNAIDSSNDMLNISQAVPAGTSVTSANNIVSYDSTGFLLNGSTSISVTASGCKGKNSRTINVSTSGRLSVVLTSC